MKMVIIVVVILALIGGGVFGTAMFAPGLLPPAVLTMLGQEIPPEPEKPEFEPRPEETVLIDLEPLQVPLFRNDDVDRFLIIHILVEVRPGEHADLVNKNLLRLIDTFITYIHALNALDIEPGVNDRAFLKDRLLVKAEEVLGEGIVVDLLFVNIFERPIK
jgi:flagellar basal body-associated protein FliL